MLRTIRDLEIQGKRVLMRCDFNTPLDAEGNVEEDFRIRQSVPTIEYLVRQGTKVILMSHLGDPKGKVVENLRLGPIQDKLTEYLDLSVFRTPDCIGPDVERQVSKLQEGEILLLENVRFHEGEEANDPIFAQALARLGDVYINDAFGTCHRAHASVVGVPQYLPSAAGFLLKKEVDALARVLKNPLRPLVAVIGGVKIETKIEPIKNLLAICDHVLVGGEIANTILRVKEICVGKLPPREIVQEIKHIDLTSPKLHLPVDMIVAPDQDGSGYARPAALARVKEGDLLLDIGPETIRMYKEILKNAKTIIWVGPLGLFENPLFTQGTSEIAAQIGANPHAFKVAGGGDTVLAIDKFKLRNSFDHISTGGGATLSFLSGAKLPGLIPLEK